MWPLAAYTGGRRRAPDCLGRFKSYPRYYRPGHLPGFSFFTRFFGQGIACAS
jgi:hypothetical protein